MREIRGGKGGNWTVCKKNIQRRDKEPQRKAMKHYQGEEEEKF